MKTTIIVSSTVLHKALLKVQDSSHTGNYEIVISDDKHPEACFFMPFPPIFGYNVPVEVFRMDKSVVSLTTQELNRLTSLTGMILEQYITISFADEFVSVTHWL